MTEVLPTKRPLTTLSEAIKVSPVPGNKYLFTGTVPWDWCAAWAAHGGILLGLIHSAAISYSLLNNPKTSHHDVLNSHIQYLSPVAPNITVRLVVRSMKAGSQFAILQVELQTCVAPSAAKEVDPENLSWKTHTLGIVTVGNLSTATGLSLPTRKSISQSEMPDRLTECEAVVHHAYFSDIAPVILKFDSWLLKGYNKTTMNSDRFGLCTRDGWYARSDGEDWDLDYLGLLCDYVDGAPSNWSPHHADLKAGVRYPTLCLTLDIKKDPKGLKWVFMRAKALKIENGRFDTCIYVYDKEGDLLAFAKHLSLIVEGKLLSKHPEELGRVFKL
ncbi:hypothetical protein VTL71DRAFT_9236 [Oculimacula yallundae]|uniref:Thioesterase-like superfamily-domain-containing protein n=1 Tax=Oculimacula yallundae TaxID=86028 RepID=A0ABR4BSH8_9HELO